MNEHPLSSMIFRWIAVAGVLATFPFIVSSFLRSSSPLALSCLKAEVSQCSALVSQQLLLFLLVPVTAVMCLSLVHFGIHLARLRRGRRQERRRQRRISSVILPVVCSLGYGIVVFSVFPPFVFEVWDFTANTDSLASRLYSHFVIGVIIVSAGGGFLWFLELAIGALFRKMKPEEESEGA